MNVFKLMAIVLIIAGISGLIYGSFTYTKETQEAKLGPLELSIKDAQTVYIPTWVGVGTILAGSGLLFFASKKR